MAELFQAMSWEQTCPVQINCLDMILCKYDIVHSVDGAHGDNVHFIAVEPSA